MKLYISPTSPYARVASITVAEAGLAGVQFIDASPWDEAAKLEQITPAAKVPALVCDDDSVVVESTCICEYLIARAGREEMLPRELQQWRILGLSRAAMDCAVGVVMQGRFGDPESPLVERWIAALGRIATQLNALTEPAPQSGERLGLDAITTVTAFEYVSFRLAAIDWQQRAPALAQWVAELGRRDAVAASAPH